MIENPSFTEEWDGNTECLVLPGLALRKVDNIQVPTGWHVWFDHDEPWAQPEGRLNTHRYIDGDTSYLLFTFYRQGRFGLYQRVAITRPCRLSFTIGCHAWSNHTEHHPDDPDWSEGPGFDPGRALTGTIPMTGQSQNDAWINATFRAGIDPGGGIDPYDRAVIWGSGWHIYNQWSVVGVTDVKILEPRVVTLFTQASFVWRFKHNDAYWDRAELICKPLDEPGHEPSRLYDRTVRLVPQDATVTEAAEALELAYPAKQTLTFSADDAFVTAPALQNRTVFVHDADRVGGSKEELEAWVEKHYPPLPEIRYIDSEPGVEPGGELLTYHMQDAVPTWERYVTDTFASPRALQWVQIVGAGMERSVRIKELSNCTSVAYRHVISHQRPFLDNPNIESVRTYLDMFWDGIRRVNEHEINIDAVVSINETIPSGNPTETRAAVEFDRIFCEEVHRRSNGDVAPIVLTVAVGNPHFYEEKLLIPAVRAAIWAGGYLGPHTYMPCAPGKALEWLATEGKYHHMRPFWSWDPTFAEHDLKPRYVILETGACATAVREDGRPGAYNPSAGWRHSTCLNGDLDLYLKLLLLYRGMLDHWNVTNENRIEGACIFTTGPDYVGWQEFKFQSKEWLALFQRMYS